MFSVQENTTTDFSDLLKQNNLSWQENKYYLFIGVPKKDHGWILHISVTHLQAKEMVEKIIPGLKQIGVAFKLIKTIQHIAHYNYGMFGPNLIGKVLTIYPSSDQEAINITNKILSVCTDYDSPEVQTDIPLGGVLYTRYGSFNTVIATNSIGQIDKGYFDNTGNFVTDAYRDPTQLPIGVEFPFKSLNPNWNTKKKRKLTENYMSVKILKQDPKGLVVKSLSFKKFPFRWCVLKQGKKSMITDDLGRDMVARLSWQYKLHKELYNVIPIPKAYDLFNVGEDSYLVLECIKRGVDYNKKCNEILAQRPWTHVPNEDKLKIIGYLEQILSAIERLHGQGYIHRDIAGTNFMITPDDKVHLIDLELMYSINSPDKPHFFGGTMGFMTPEQEDRQLPRFEDDIYAIGALIMCSMIPIWPTFILDLDLEVLKERLEYFIGDQNLIKLVLSCKNRNAGYRPNISVLRSKIYEYKQSILNDSVPIPHNPVDLSKDKILEIVSKGICCIQEEIITEDGLWYTSHRGTLDIPLHERENISVLPGIYYGVSGPLYLYNSIQKSGLNIPIDKEVKRRNLRFLLDYFANNLTNTIPGLYHGTAGIAKVILEYSCLNTDSSMSNIQEIILNGICRPPSGLDILSGMAGQGLAALYCYEIFKIDKLFNWLRSSTNQLIQFQQSDGSWLLSSKTKVTGFGYGIAGICYYLFEYYRRLKDEKALESAFKGLKYLTLQINKERQYYSWKESNTDKRIGNWWCNGGPGIALAYLKAYEITGESSYKVIAEKSLRINNDDIITYNLSQCHGLTGLGEIYIEASKILETEEWWHRATWIANVVCVQKRRSSKNNYYWFAETPDTPLSDFMLGNSGIIHFLLRYINPVKIDFPIL